MTWIRENLFLKQEVFIVRKFKKISLSNSVFPIFCPCGHLMDYHLPNVDNCGHLANYHLPHFVHVVIEQPLDKKRFKINQTKNILLLC